MILSSNILRIIREEFLLNLSDIYDRNEIISLFRILANEYLGMNSAILVLSLDETISKDALGKFDSALQELQQCKPIQYILGKTEFLDHTFYISKDVFIPRPETEELVNWMISDYKADNDVQTLDIGIGR